MRKRYINGLASSLRLTARVLPTLHFVHKVIQFAEAIATMPPRIRQCEINRLAVLIKRILIIPLMHLRTPAVIVYEPFEAVKIVLHLQMYRRGCLAHSQKMQCVCCRDFIYVAEEHERRTTCVCQAALDEFCHGTAGVTLPNPRIR